MSIRGVIVPLVSPFDDQFAVALDKLETLVGTLVAHGVDGLIVCASTGEALALSEAERAAIIDLVLATNAGQVPVYVGCSSYSTDQVIGLIDDAATRGATGAMITHPYYALPDPIELLAHYTAVSARIEVPVIVYNNPATTGIDASPEQLAEIVALPHMDAIKESSGDCTRVTRINRLTGNTVPVLCGTDHQAMEQLAAGAVGWVAGVANVMPRECLALHRATQANDLKLAKAITDCIYAYLSEAELTGKYVQVNKLGLQLTGLEVGPPRPPLLPVTGEGRDRVIAALEQARGASSLVGS